MDLDSLTKEFESEEHDRKRRVQEIRRVKRGGASWTDSLILVADTPQERVKWAATIERDAQALKNTTPDRVSKVFVQGPEEDKGLPLAKLIVGASMANKVNLPKQVLADLRKSGLIDQFIAMSNAQQVV